MPAAAQRDRDRPAGGIFAGVIQIDLHQLPQLLCVSHDGNPLLDLRLERQPAFIERRLKHQRGIPGQLAEIQRGGVRQRPSALHPRQLQQALDQRAHLPRHGGNAVCKLPPVFLVKGPALQQLRICQDHRQRRLQLMRRIRDELLLLLPRSLDRPDRPACQQQRQAEKRQQAHRADAGAGAREAPERLPLAGRIRKDHALHPRGRHAAKAQIIFRDLPGRLTTGKRRLRNPFQKRMVGKIK